MIAGAMSRRTRVASRMTAVARAKPNSLSSSTSATRKQPKTAAMIVAAATIGRAV
jgi:hypothetical protein